MSLLSLLFGLETRSFFFGLVLTEGLIKVEEILVHG